MKTWQFFLISFLSILLIGSIYVFNGINNIEVTNYELSNATYEGGELNLTASITINNPSPISFYSNIKYNVTVNNNLVDQFNQDYLIAPKEETIVQLWATIDMSDLTTIIAELITQDKVILRVQGQVTNDLWITEKEYPIEYEFDIKELLIEQTKQLIQEKLGDLINIF